MGLLEYRKNTTRVFSEFYCHCHSVYEIYYFITGDCDIMIEGNVYKLTPHTLILLAPGVLHGIQVNSPKPYIRTVLYLTLNDLMPERLHLLTNLIPNIKKNPNEVFIYEHIQKFELDRFFYNLKQIEGQPADIKNLLQPIYNEALIAQIILVSRTTKSNNKRFQGDHRIAEIVNYINLHLAQPLTLDSLSNEFFISKNYLNKLFKQHLGMTIIEYIRYKRVILARQYILQEHDTAINAALRVGFTDYSSFYRTYMKYMGTSPREDMMTGTALEKMI